MKRVSFHRRLPQQRAPRPRVSDPESTLATLLRIVQRPLLKPQRVLHAFGLESGILPTHRHELSPFAYFSTVNSNESYVSHPRLAVTRLLTDGWCELQQWFDIYAGSVPRADTTRLDIGSRYHKQLELAVHAFPTLEEVQAVTGIELLEGGKTALQFADTIAKLVALAKTGECREALVTAFLNLDKDNVEKTVTEESVIVNGVADILLLKNSKAVENWKTAGPVGGTLLVGDVKTRMVNSVPHQLQVDAARDQCLFYSEFILMLAADRNYAKLVFLASARRRGAEVTPRDLVVILLMHHDVLSPDKSRASAASDLRFPELLERFQGRPFSNLKVWLPTMETFAELLADAFALFKETEVTLVFVEYHNYKTARVIDVRAFPADGIQNAVEKATLFWSGKRTPRPTAERARCMRCDYREACPAINRLDIGQELEQIL